MAITREEGYQRALDFKNGFVILSGNADPLILTVRVRVRMRKSYGAYVLLSQRERYWSYSL